MSTHSSKACFNAFVKSWEENDVDGGHRCERS